MIKNNSTITDAVTLASKSLDYYSVASKDKKVKTSKDLVNKFEGSIGISKSTSNTTPVALVKRMLAATFRIMKK